MARGGNPLSPLSVGYSDLAVAAILVVLNAALTWMLDLGLSRIILIAGLRAIVQLLLVGMVLKTVFALASPLLIGAVARDVRHGELRNQFAPGAPLCRSVGIRYRRRNHDVGNVACHGLCAARHATTGSMVRTRGTDTLARDHPRQRHERGQRHPQRAQYVDYARAAGHRS